jgi:hypothetical protein
LRIKNGLTFLIVAMIAIGFIIVLNALFITKAAYAHHCGIGVDHEPNDPNVPPPEPSVVIQRAELSGPHLIHGHEVNTGVSVNAGDIFRVTSTGKVDFGGAFVGFGARHLNADGDDPDYELADKCPTPTNYPAPNLAKNSLIVKVGGNWHQGGTNRIITASASGTIILAANDNMVGDNSGGWSVFVTKFYKEHFRPQVSVAVLDDKGNIASLRVGGPQAYTFSRNFKLDFAVENLAQIRQQLENVDSIVCILKKGESSYAISQGIFMIVNEDNCNRNGYSNLTPGVYRIEIKAHDTTDAWGPTYFDDWIIAEPDTKIISATDGNNVPLPLEHRLQITPPPSSLSSPLSSLRALLPPPPSPPPPPFGSPSLPPSPPWPSPSLLEHVPITSSNLIEFKFEGIETNIPNSKVTFMCKSPASASPALADDFEPCISPKKLMNLAPNIYTFSVKAVTKDINTEKKIAGTEDLTPASFTWRIN